VCYYKDDCATGEYCNYEGCDHIKVDGKLKDGLCKKAQDLFAAGEVTDGADALDLLLQAFAVAGSTGTGGPPDPALVAQAQGIPLSPEQHDFIRVLTISVMVAHLGVTDSLDDEPHLHGFVSLPELSGDCEFPYLPADYGSVEPLDACHLAVSDLIRQGMVGEIKSTTGGILDGFINEIPLACAEYETFLRCEYPHPPEHGHEFPYPNGITCLLEELRGAAETFPDPTTAIKKSGWGHIKKLFR
jgi:hypothetical protein